MAAGCWGGGESTYHLHSRASVFCGGEDDEGLIPVSEDADDIDAPVLDTVKKEEEKM